MGITVEIDSKYVRDSLGRFVTQIPQVAKKDAKKIAEKFLESLKEGSPDWGGSPLTIKGSLSIDEVERGYGIHIVKHGFLLDSMEYHAAPSGFGETKNPLMKKWIMENKPGYTLPYIWVKPKPWIDKAIQPVSEEMRNYFKSDKSELRKFLNKLGR